MRQADGEHAGRLTLALLRATLLAVILINENLVQAQRLVGLQFFLVLSIAGAYALGGIGAAVLGSDGPYATAFARLAPGCDVFVLAAVTYTSGGAYSDVRKAFFVIPLAAAFTERPRSTAGWSLVAVLAFSLQAAVAAGHPSRAADSWTQAMVDQDLYLAWTGAAATLLATALRRRSAQTEELARSRQRLVTQAIDAVERERTRLAGALHDWPVQNLIAARHDLRRAERGGDRETFGRLREAIDTTIAQLREEISNLHPHVLDHVGLAAALEQVARRHAQDGRLTVTVEADPDADEDPAHRLVLFALGRELLGNAVKHSGASEVWLSLTYEPERVTLLVVDDGRGIPNGRLRQALLDGHIGLAAVRERVGALGGSLDITSAPEAGTRVHVTLPRQPDAPRRSEAEISDRVTSRATLGVSTA